MPTGDGHQAALGRAQPPRELAGQRDWHYLVTLRMKDQQRNLQRLHCVAELVRLEKRIEGLGIGIETEVAPREPASQPLDALRADCHNRMGLARRSGGMRSSTRPSSLPSLDPCPRWSNAIAANPAPRTARAKS